MTKVQHKSEELLSAELPKTIILDTKSYLYTSKKTSANNLPKNNFDFLPVANLYNEVAAGSMTDVVCQAAQSFSVTESVASVTGRSEPLCKQKMFQNNKKANTQNINPESCMKSQSVAKKRLSTIFENFQLIIIWASIDPIVKKKWKLFFSDGETVGVNPIVKETLSLQNIKIGKLPKDTLNNHCTNLNFSMVGCNVDYLAVKHQSDKIIEDCSNNPLGSAFLRESTNKGCGSEAAPKRLVTADNTKNFNNSYFFNAHQIAAILNVLSKVDKKNQKLHSPSQLLGAFIQDARNFPQGDKTNAEANIEQYLPFSSVTAVQRTKQNKSMIFIGGYELRQSLILQRNDQSHKYGLVSAATPYTGSQLYAGVIGSSKKTLQKPLNCAKQTFVKQGRLVAYSAKRLVNILALKIGKS